MKTKCIIWIVLLVSSFLVTCKNREIVTLSQRGNDIDSCLSVSEAQSWFQSDVVNSIPKNARIDGASNKEAIWKHAVVRQSSTVGPVIVVPIKFLKDLPLLSLKSSSSETVASEKGINFASRLVIWKNKKGKLEYRVHQLFPDEDYHRKNGNAIKDDFSGIVTISDFDGNFVNGFKMNQGKVVGKLSSALKAGRTANCASIIIYWFTKVCVNDNCFDPRFTHTEEYWVCEQTDHGSDGVTPPPTVTNPTVVTNNYSSDGQFVYQIDSQGQNVDAREYLKCFGRNSNSNSIFRVKIFVDQVLPGYRSLNLNASNSSPGHVFIGLEETTDGQSIARTIGFYPSDIVNPITPASGGHTEPDERSYDVSLTVEVNQAQFEGIILKLEATANSEYNLNSNNCTHYVVNSCSGNGINLPRTIGTWWQGSGLNPSDLGEDIRTMTLLPGMTRNTDGGYPSPNQGSCQ